jgi:hypothetical protein
MAIIGLEADKNIGLNIFMRQTEKRLKEMPLLDGKILRIPLDNRDDYVLIIDPLFPKFYLMGLLMIFITLYFTGPRLTAWLLPGFAVFAGGVFWSKPFFMLILWIALRKKKYKGKIKFVTNNKVIRKMVEHTL